VFEQDLLDPGEVDVLTAGFDEILPAVDEAVGSVGLVDTRDTARCAPAILEIHDPSCAGIPYRVIGTSRNGRIESAGQEGVPGTHDVGDVAGPELLSGVTACGDRCTGSPDTASVRGVIAVSIPQPALLNH
jgi:hypothetical protein